MRGKIKHFFSSLIARKKNQKVPLKYSKYGTWALLKMTIRLGGETVKSFWVRHRVASRLIALFMLLVILFGLYNELWRAQKTESKYNIGRVQNLLPRTMDLFSQKLTRSDDGSYSYNQGYTAGNVDASGQISGPKFTADFSSDTNAKVRIGDPSNNVDVNITTDFNVDYPLKNENRVVYPIKTKDAAIIYTLQASRVKEDIILYSFSGDVVSFTFNLDLNEAMQARLESDGSVSVYGVDSVLLGQVSTSTSDDEELLSKARQNANKDKLLFTIPKPYVLESYGLSNVAKSWYSLENNKLTVHASGLAQATYPLSIDPTIYIETAAKLMRGNNETNTDFDVDNELIQKSQTSGAR
ncbi:MAG: hypothetical protein Q7T74_06195, partial [Candidatus Saccharibacteria bacterium]|nr:hypothetical protein [Candidatus Saccharibacteria bacterium]